VLQDLAHLKQYQNYKRMKILSKYLIGSQLFEGLLNSQHLKF